ncbi:MAG: glycosyltransferase family 2 protein [Lutibacter sp.]|uniref:glycosyltransferase family 2 protein n=1 Tax=Lutibacter sp. TaxID=1925666 RepID=UPI00180C3724|nr:glycosyltransferase family 2 protein [Lutibacter sp.]MBT8318248.1 glycosyltransferase [Lutibacter sp.]NNJ59107.1 glycosyltransferase family 2 protein [Lutibacter sp.]
MISVLIPVYNYKVQPLIENLIYQFEKLNCTWEILVSDDASQSEFQTENIKFINSIRNLNIKLFLQEVNLGNALNRNYLLEKASYNWLLFLDADVFPVHNNFLSVFIDKLESTDKDIIAGNVIYDTNNPLPHLLRWRYGKKKEEISFTERENNPILNLRGANFAIRKSIMLISNFPVLKEKYGFVDTRFFLQFNKNQICVIDNPVYHLGIEENSFFLEKTKKAISNALFLLNENDRLADQISLVSTYKKIRFLKVILSNIYVRFHKSLEKNIYSDKPSIFLFQTYKILYLSYLDNLKIETNFSS